MTVPLFPSIQRRSRALLIVVGAVFTTACASTGATPRPFPMPGAAAPPRIADAPPPAGDAAGTEVNGAGLEREDLPVAQDLSPAPPASTPTR